MSTALTTQPKASALALMAGRMNVEPAKLLATLKSTVFKSATDDELLALVVVANEYGLNPLLKELYAFPAKGGGIVPVVSVDGWVKLANSHPMMDGLEFEWAYDGEGKLVACTAVFWRKDRNRPVKVTEYLAECKRNTEPWKMEHRMLRHKALIQGARVAFGFSGIMDDEEAESISITVSEPQIATPRLDLPKERRARGTQQAEEVKPKPAPNFQDELAKLVNDVRCNFDDFKRVAAELGLFTEGEDIATGFDELSDDLCARCIAYPSGLKAALAVAKEVTK